MKSELKMIQFTRAFARSANEIVINAALVDEDADHPESRIFRFIGDREPDERWLYDDFNFHMQDITIFYNSEVEDGAHYLTYMSSEGDVYHAWWKGNFQEKIRGAGTWADDAKGYGRILAFKQIGDDLYACGQGGQIYRRDGRDIWTLVDDTLLFDMQRHLESKENRPLTTDPGYLEWLLNFLSQSQRNVSLNDINGLSEHSIYVCGEVGPGAKPVLCYWDGEKLHELKVPLAEAALTGIYIENEDSVWICGREGVLIHGSYARGFTPVHIRQQLNLFHMITPYRGKLVLPSSVRPGGLYEFDPATTELKRFSPALPKLRGSSIFFAQAIDGVLWVVGLKDIFRFDGLAWERIEHPDL